MNKEELCNILSETLKYENQLIGEIYFVLKVNDALELKLADIECTSQSELTQQFINQIRTDILENEELHVMGISNADERSNVIYEYDLAERPSELSIFDEALYNEDINNFNFKNNNLSSIKGFLILISHENDTLLLYKHHYPVSYLKQESSFNLVKLGNSERFVKLESDILKINSTYDFLQINDTLFIRNMKILESYFKFHDVIISNARNSLNVIREADIIDNPEELENMLNNISYARKLLRVARTSPVLGKVPNTEIINFINNFPTLKGKLELNEDRDKICLTTNKSKEILLKILNDDYLHSQLTQYFYSSLAKDTIGEPSAS